MHQKHNFQIIIHNNPVKPSSSIVFKQLSNYGCYTFLVAEGTLLQENMNQNVTYIVPLKKTPAFLMEKSVPNRITWELALVQNQPTDTNCIWSDKRILVGAKSSEETDT